MHLMIPHASALDEAARHAFSALALPNLAALLGRLSPAETWGSDEFSPQPPHHIEPGRRRRAADVERRDARARFEERLGPDGAQLAAGAGDDGDAVVEGKASAPERANSLSGLLNTSNDRKSSSCSGLSVVRPITLSRS